MAGQLSLASKPEPVENIGACQVYDAIVASHAAPEWAVFPEVSDATGGRASRRADAMAFNLWPSRGLEIRGFEIKVSRSDLKRELEDPSKADALGVYCDTWCLAVPAGLLRDSDPVPPTWGIFVVKGGSGRFQRLPVSRPREEVKAPTRLFMAAIARAGSAEAEAMRKGGDWIRRESVQGEIDNAMERGRRQAPDHNRVELQSIERKWDAAKKILDPLGIDVDRLEWKGGEDYATALKIGMSFLRQYGNDAVEYALREVCFALDPLKKTRDALKSLLKRREVEQPPATPKAGVKEGAPNANQG